MPTTTRLDGLAPSFCVVLYRYLFCPRLRPQSTVHAAPSADCAQCTWASRPFSLATHQVPCVPRRMGLHATHSPSFVRVACLPASARPTSLPRQSRSSCLSLCPDTTQSQHTRSARLSMHGCNERRTRLCAINQQLLLSLFSFFFIRFFYYELNLPFHQERSLTPRF